MADTLRDIRSHTRATPIGPAFGKAETVSRSKIKKIALKDSEPFPDRDSEAKAKARDK